MSIQELVYEQSEENRKYSEKTAPKTIKALSAPAHNYSTQSLNSTEQAKEALRQVLAQVSEMECGAIIMQSECSKIVTDSWSISSKFTSTHWPLGDLNVILKM